MKAPRGRCFGPHIMFVHKFHTLFWCFHRYFEQEHVDWEEIDLAFLLLTLNNLLSQPGFACSKLTIETLEQGVKYVQN